MITIAIDGSYRVTQISANRIALFCTEGRYAHETPMFMSDLADMAKMIETMHKNAKMHSIRAFWPGI